MKKKLCFYILLLLLCFALVGCANSQEDKLIKEYEQISDTELMGWFYDVGTVYDNQEPIDIPWDSDPQIDLKIKNISRDLAMDVKLDDFSKTEVMLLLKSRFEQLIEYNNTVGKVYWNEKFVESYIKEYFPDLYGTIKEQLDENKSGENKNPENK